MTQLSTLLLIENGLMGGKVGRNEPSLKMSAPKLFWLGSEGDSKIHSQRLTHWISWSETKVFL